MTRYIKRHSLQARLTHGITAIACIILAITGLFVFVPTLTATVSAQVLFVMRIIHRVVGVVFILVPVISAATAPKSIKHLLSIYFAKWDKDDVTFMKKFLPYLLVPKKVHMPDQHEVKSGQRFADGILFLGGLSIGLSGILLLLGTTVVELSAQVMLAMRFIHDLAFVILCIFGIAHIYLGSGVFQPYRGSHRLMFGDGRVAESDALYHWGHWAREEIEKGENISYVDEDVSPKSRQ